MASRSFILGLKNLTLNNDFNYMYFTQCVNLLGFYSIKNSNCWASSFSISKSTVCDDENSNQKRNRIFISKDGTETKKIFPTTTKIKLYDIKGTYMSMYMEEAEKLAKRNNWKLEKTINELGETIYKITKGKTYGEPSQKKFKKIIFSSKILPHDIDTKIQNVLKQTGKGKEICILIENHSSNAEKLNELSQIIQGKLIGKCTIKGSQKSSKAVKFLVYPLVQSQSDEQ